MKRDQADGGTDVNGTETRGLANPKGDVGLPCSRFIESNVLNTLKCLELALSSYGAYNCFGIDYNTYKYP